MYVVCNDFVVYIYKQLQYIDRYSNSYICI